jgi:hypothetical protein
MKFDRSAEVGLPKLTGVLKDEGLFCKMNFLR